MSDQKRHTLAPCHSRCLAIIASHCELILRDTICSRCAQSNYIRVRETNDKRPFVCSRKTLNSHKEALCAYSRSTTLTDCRSRAYRQTCRCFALRSDVQVLQAGHYDAANDNEIWILSDDKIVDNAVNNSFCSCRFALQYRRPVDCRMRGDAAQSLICTRDRFALAMNLRAEISINACS